VTGGYFITGTDTGVGKTLIASALIRKLAASGLRCVGMKPVAAGCRLDAGRRVNEDVECLRAQANLDAADELICPYLLAEPLAPHIAAAKEGAVIERGRILRAFRVLSNLADCTVVEGVGGFRVPLDTGFDTADLACDLGLPLILVVGLRLGCLNHALLSVEAIDRRGLKLAGWVANRVDPGMPALHENVEALRSRIDAPLLASVPIMTSPDPARIASLLLDPGAPG
jgi:dethiobiotin synthetase